MACEGLDLARRRQSLALAGALRSGRGWRRSFRATGKAGTHLGLERVKTTTGTDGFQDAIQRQTEDHDVATRGDFGVIRLLRQRREASEAAKDPPEMTVAKGHPAMTALRDRPLRKRWWTV